MEVTTNSKNEVITYVLLQICSFIASIGLTVVVFIISLPMIIGGFLPFAFPEFYSIIYVIFRIVFCKLINNNLVKNHVEQMNSKRLKVAVTIYAILSFLLAIFINWILFELYGTYLDEQIGGFDKNIFELAFDLIRVVVEELGSIITKIVLTICPVLVWIRMNYLIDNKKRKG